MWMDILRGSLGIASLVALGYLFSVDRKAIAWKYVGIGLLIQIIFGILVLKVSVFYEVFSYLSAAFVKIIDFSDKGSEFIFGSLSDTSSFGFIFAVRVLPTIIFFSALTSGLYYLGILQKVVYGIAWVMRRALNLSGAESLSAAGNIFLGQTEAPLLIRHYLKEMNRSQIFCIMVGGMATLAGGVLASYIGFLGGESAESRQFFATSLLTASIMNAPGAIIMAKLIVPQNEPSRIDNQLSVSSEKIGVNLIDALAIGAADGLKLAAIIAGMLIAFISLIYLVNDILQVQIGEWNFGNQSSLNHVIQSSTSGQFDGLSLQYIFGQLFRPLAWLIGVEWKDTLLVGSLLGEKTVINEFIAYKSLSQIEPGVLAEKSRVIATFALCSFSNFSSIAIQVGGLGSLEPSKRPMISQLGLRAVLAGTLACLLSASIAGTLV